MGSERFIEFVSRYPKKSYGAPSDAPKVDTRQNTGLDMVASVTRAYYTTAHLMSDFDDAIVCAILRHEEPEGSSLNPELNIIASSNEVYDLKCFVLTRPLTSHIGYKNIASLDPVYVSLLPAFKATLECSEVRPKLGDVVVVKYDSLTYTSGVYIKPTGINVADMFSDSLAEKSLPDQFRDSPRYEPPGDV